MALVEKKDAQRGEPGLVSTYRMDEAAVAVHGDAAPDSIHGVFPETENAEPSSEEEAVMLKSALVICAIFLSITALLLVFGPRFVHV